MATERRSPNVFSLGDRLEIAGIETEVTELTRSAVYTTGDVRWTYPQLLRAVRGGALGRERTREHRQRLDAAVARIGSNATESE
jgi:hypothetical protein